MPTSDAKLLEESLRRGAARAQKLMAADAAIAFAPNAGTLIAEGDSWLDYPLFQDIVEALETDHHYRVRSAAHFGDSAESMAYDTKQLDRVRRLFQDLAESGDPAQVPKGVILSCGGNDIVDTFSLLLNHVESGLAAVNEDIARGLLDVRLKAALGNLVGTMQAFAEHYFPGQAIPMVIHGYGYAVPDGRGYPFGFSGPWLKPAFARRGYVTADPQGVVELGRNAALIQLLIDRLNDVILKDLAAQPSMIGKLHYVDLRPVFTNSIEDGEYLTTWRDEMHATRPAFQQAARMIAQALR